MWKLNETPRRRSPQFDPLEGRQLLSGAFFPAPQAEFVTIAAGPPLESGGMSAHVDGPSSDPSPGYVPAWQGPVASMGTRGGDLYAMAFAPVDQAQAVSSIGSEPGPVWMHGQMDGAESNEGSASQAGFAGHATSVETSVTIALPSGWTFSAWAFTPGGGVYTSTSSATPGLNTGGTGSPSAGQPGGYDPGQTVFSGRPDGQEPPAGSMDAPPVPTGMEFAQARGRTDPFETAPSFAGPLNAPAGANGQGPPAIAALTPNPGTASTGAGSGAQPAASTVSLPSQLAMVTESDGPVSDRAVLGFASAHRVDARGMFEPGRLPASAGRSALATTRSHPPLVRVAAVTDADSSGRLDAVPAPRGADLIAESLPFAGDSLERRLDDFIRQLEEVDVAKLVGRGPTPIVIATVAVASTAASAVVVREIVRRRAERGRGARIVDSLGRELALSFPELPRSWSRKRR